MRTRRPATLDDLRRTIQCLPRHTREAMLAGLDANPIIVGAYTSEDGICPMLAAHRNGGRTAAISFARAWDRFAFRDARSARRARRAGTRRATERELLILRAHLEASLLDDDAPTASLAAARREHAALLASRPADHDRPRPAERKGARDRPRPGDPDRSRELGRHRGWAWTRIVRRYDEYERVLAHVREAEAEAEARAELETASAARQL
jgi:hypothetical protein